MDFAHYKVSEWVMMIKVSYYLSFVLQIYVSVESLKKKIFWQRSIAKSEIGNKGNTKGKQEKYLENP